ncbi:YgaB family protein [Oikeobacillus pervagus]|uniref:YgaB family protein n=1 Tax=Oikeobacillus pervagus TaxID=1325931 RepID=UPI0027D8F9C1|nr:YgaB family protein [Oikeobacillus pervagus]
MNQFNELVLEQMKTMDKLLYLQSEIERCQELEGELMKLHDLAKLDSIKQEINEMKKELKEIQQVFEAQTDQVIRTYQQQNRVLS